MKNYFLTAIASLFELGKNGHKIDGSNLGYVGITDKNGDPIEVRGKDASHANGLVTKQQLESATGSDVGTVWIEYSTEPTVSNFSSGTPKLFDLTTGVATLLTDYSTIPNNTSWDGSDERTYIIDITNGLITPNNLNKQSTTLSIEIAYDNMGSNTNLALAMRFTLVEYNGSNEHREISSQFHKSNNDSGSGVLTINFNTNVTSQVNGSGKGWRLYVTSLENDSNGSVKIKSIRQQCG